MFEWDAEKERFNIKKHDVSFDEAKTVFFDKQRIIAYDEKHSEAEERWFCIGKVGTSILTVRFVYRNHKIRIIGAGSWRKGKKLYEEENK